MFQAIAATALSDWNQVAKRPNDDTSFRLARPAFHNSIGGRWRPGEVDGGPGRQGMGRRVSCVAIAVRCDINPVARTLWSRCVQPDPYERSPVIFGLGSSKPVVWRFSQALCYLSYTHRSTCMVATCCSVWHLTMEQPTTDFLRVYGDPPLQSYR